MAPIATAFACLLVAGVSLWGWGWLLLRALRRPAPAWPVTIAIGLAIVVFVGGCLSLAHLARAPAFDATLVAGLIAAAVGGLRAWRGSHPRVTGGGVIAALPVLAAAGFVAACLLPPAAYNVHDDLEKYFAVPVRMLATGTLAANPLSSVGAETLGGQAVLHAFVAAHFPLTYLGTVDGWFGLTLVLALAAFGRPCGRWGLAAAAAAVVASSIDPLLVNISSLFTGAALMAAAVLVGVRVAEDDGSGRDGLVFGVLGATLIVLKPTFAVFTGLFVTSLLAMELWLGGRRWRWLLWLGGGAAVALAPWLLLHLPLYLSSGDAGGAVPPGPREPLALFSRRVTGYGVAQLPYTLLVVAALVTAVVLAMGMARGRLARTPARRVACAAAVTAVLVYAGFVVIGPGFFGQLGATRYACPVLIATVPLVLRLLTAEVRAEGWRGEVAAVGVAVAVAAAFLPATVERPRQWWREHTPLAFFARAQPGQRQEYRNYNRQVFSGLVQSKLAWLQELVPAGEPLVVWVSTPFLLDFRRNPIYNAEPAGLSMRWAHWPGGARYVLLEYQGFAVRTEQDHQAWARSSQGIDRWMAARVDRFSAELRRRAASAKVLYRDPSYVLLRWEEAGAR